MLVYKIIVTISYGVGKHWLTYCCISTRSVLLIQSCKTLWFCKSNPFFPSQMISGMDGVHCHIERISVYHISVELAHQQV